MEKNTIKILKWQKKGKTLCLFLEALGENLFPAPLGCWHNSASCGCRPEVPVLFVFLLLAVRWGPAQHRRGLFFFLAHGLFISEPAIGKWVLLTTVFFCHILFQNSLSDHSQKQFYASKDSCDYIHLDQYNLPISNSTTVKASVNPLWQCKVNIHKLWGLGCKYYVEAIILPINFLYPLNPSLTSLTSQPWLWHPPVFCIYELVSVCFKISHVRSLSHLFHWT